MGISPSAAPIVDLFYLITKSIQKALVKDQNNGFNLNVRPSDDYTIIIPVYNKAEAIEKTLYSWRNYKDNIILVDDASTDNSVEIIKKRGFRIIEKKKNEKKIGAIYDALQNIDTKYTVLVDADVRLDRRSEKTLDDIVGEIDQEGLEGGTCEIISETLQRGNRMLLDLQFIDHKCGMRIGKKAMGTGKKKYVLCSGGFGIYRTDVLKKTLESQICKPKVTFYGEDLERNFEIINNGGEIGYFEGFRVKAEAPATLKEFTKQRINWKRGIMKAINNYKGLVYKKGKLSVETSFETIFNTIGNPIKVVALPALIYFGVQDPEWLSGFYLAYVGLNLGTMKYTLKKEFKEYWGYAFIYPFFKLYETVIGLAAYYNSLKEKIQDRKEDKFITLFGNQNGVF